MNLEPASLLHNMSAPPKTVVQFEGLRALAGPLFRNSDAQRLHGTAFRFRLDAALLGLRPAQLLLAIDPASRVRTHSRAEALLLQRIDQRADELPLPDGCLLLKASDAHEIVWNDPLTALAILAKCTDTVWLRAKPSSLEVALAHRDVSLLVPPGFVHRMPATPQEVPSHG